MATNIRDGFLSPQVWVTKRKVRGKIQVAEVLGRLTPARVEYAENIFGGEKYIDENGNSKRDYSLLTLVITDGVGEKRKSVKYNFTPNNFTALRRESEASIIYHKPYDRKFEKTNCIDRKMTMRTITIRYEHYKKERGKDVLDESGKPVVSQYPWFIGISEIKGDSDANGEKMVKETEKKQSYILLSSDDYQAMLDSTCRYIDVYAMSFGVPLLREKAKQALKRMQEYWAKYPEKKRR